MQNLMVSLEIGRFFPNKTAKYLFPILNTYSKEFLNQFNKISESLMCVAIGDLKYEYAKRQEIRHCLFFIIDVNGKFDIGLNRYISEIGGRSLFNEFLIWIRKYKYYENDYLLSINGNKHCVILKLPDRFHGSYDAFLESSYSKMYNMEQLGELKIKKMNGNTPNHIWSILTKDIEYKKVFETKLNNFFGTHIVVDDDREFDLPINITEEKLNME